jgi:hypothetical protein
VTAAARGFRLESHIPQLVRASRRDQGRRAGMRGALTAGMKARSAVLLILAACSPDTATDTAPKPASTLTGKTPDHMRNCPSSVVSASTRASPTQDGVDIFVTSTQVGARDEILARAERQGALRGPFPFVREHTGHHGGPGNIGFCPIIHAGTMLSIEPIADGVRIHVAARDPADVPALRRATDERVRAIARPSS